jgi:hypothetical protein
LDKEQFLEIVKGYNREEFREYLLNAQNRKQKLVRIITLLDEDGKPDKNQTW